MCIIKGIVSIFLSALIALSGLIGMTGDKGTENEDYRTYKNVILMIGDGMGFNTIAATKATKTPNLAMDNMPVLCESETRSFTNRVTDSAAGATALACGVRTYNGAIGVYLFAPLANKWHVPKSLTELAIENGKAAGVVTTDSTSGATPACFSAHTYERGNEKGISKDQLASELDLIWGAASESINAENCAENGFEYVTTATQMNALEAGTRSFAQFDWDDIANITNEKDTPRIDAMTEKAIELLNDDEDGFFLMVEGAHIDKFSHSNILDGSTSHVVEFSNAIQVALDFAAEDGDTLVLVTADHETGGITYNAETGEYYYTTGSHTGVNVPIYVSATDAGFVSGEAYKNCAIPVQLARVMGFDDEQFPSIKN
ncbi:MAG: alkaline phosphatase [Clostridia bacterium]|nr:alkaline phosphatase [Clostridia bacterium]